MTYRKKKHILMGLGLLSALAGVFPVGAATGFHATPVYHSYSYAGLGDVRIVFASDIHAQSYFPHTKVRDLVDGINELEPDVVVFGGDSLEPGPGADWILEEYSRISVPLKIAVLGNHELGQAGLTLTHGLEKSGFVVLQDQNVEVNDNLVITGTSYPPVELRPSLDKNKFRILVTHNPDFINQYFGKLKPEYDLILAGHLHGGQIRLLGRAFVVPSEYGEGWLKRSSYNGVPVIVSNGVGTSNLLHLRINSPAHVEVIDLKKK